HPFRAIAIFVPIVIQIWVGCNDDCPILPCPPPGFNRSTCRCEPEGNTSGTGGSQSDSGNDAEAGDGTAVDAPDCTLVPTPGGMAPLACIIGVPNGAEVSINDAGETIVMLDGGIVATYPPCPCPIASD